MNNNLKDIFDQIIEIKSGTTNRNVENNKFNYSVLNRYILVCSCVCDSNGNRNN